jgi:hypothetical protein
MAGLLNLSKTRRVLAAAVTMLGAGSAAAPMAQEVYLEHERYGSWEMALHVDRLGSQRLSGIANADLSVEDTVGWGASVSYNINNQWSVGMEFLGATPDYQPILANPTADRDFELDFTNTLFKGTWHMRPEGLTPFVTLGAGWTGLDSNIASDEPVVDCWWDPWWGRQCSRFYPTYNDTRATVSATAGIRWDFHTQFFTRISYGKMWIGLDDDTSSPTVTRLEFGIRR